MENNISVRLDPKHIETSISLLNQLYDTEGIELQILDQDKFIPIHRPEEVRSQITDFLEENFGIK